MKCKDCKYLDTTQKTKVGYVCTNVTRRRGTTRTLGHLKYKHTPACKTGFEQIVGGVNERNIIQS